MREIIRKTIVYDNAEERATVRSWGETWGRMKNYAKREGTVPIIFGNWSGYHSGQRKLTHTEFDPILSQRIKNMGRPLVVYFTDNTTMTVWVKEMTIREIVEGNFRQKNERLGYGSLIREAAEKDRSTYHVQGTK